MVYVLLIKNCFVLRYICSMFVCEVTLITGQTQRGGEPVLPLCASRGSFLALLSSRKRLRFSDNKVFSRGWSIVIELHCSVPPEGSNVIKQRKCCVSVTKLFETGVALQGLLNRVFNIPKEFYDT